MPIGCGATGAYAPGPDDKEEEPKTFISNFFPSVVCSK